jgi:hypothetical protein
VPRAPWDSCRIEIGIDVLRITAAEEADGISNRQEFQG